MDISTATILVATDRNSALPTGLSAIIDRAFPELSGELEEAKSILRAAGRV
jgi:hypothetical protein